MFPAIRIILGILFIISGGEKLLTPSENFAYVIEGYKVFPLSWANVIAQIFPWVETLTGLFLVLGLWLRPALAVLMLMSASLIGIVGQAILRRLPLDNCGCFGELIHLPLRGVILLDISVGCLALLCWLNIKETLWMSLDAFYKSQEKH
jgi:hypothetical protein